MFPAQGNFFDFFLHVMPGGKKNERKKKNYFFSIFTRQNKWSGKL